MGDRGNIFVKDGKEHGVYLYAHWHGSVLPGILRDALRRSESRWRDSQYLARIIFCEMIKQGAENLNGLLGFGISSRLWDNEHEVIEVDPDAATVTIGNRSWGFGEFIDLEEESIHKTRKGDER